MNLSIVRPKQACDIMGLDNHKHFAHLTCMTKSGFLRQAFWLIALQSAAQTKYSMCNVGVDEVA